MPTRAICHNTHTVRRGQDALLYSGCDVNEKDKDGKTGLDLCERQQLTDGKENLALTRLKASILSAAQKQRSTAEANSRAAEVELLALLHKEEEEGVKRDEKKRMKKKKKKKKKNSERRAKNETQEYALESNDDTQRSTEDNLGTSLDKKSAGDSKLARGQVESNASVTGSMHDGTGNGQPRCVLPQIVETDAPVLAGELASTLEVEALFLPPHAFLF